MGIVLDEVIILLSKLLGDYNSLMWLYFLIYIILLSKLLGDYNLAIIDNETGKIILLSKLLGDYNFIYSFEIIT